MRTVEPPAGFSGEAYVEDGPAINGDFLNGLHIDEAKRSIIEWLEDNAHGSRTVTYKLRDWLFRSSDYWGEPFPIVFDETGLALAVPEDQLPVELPELMDWARALDEESEPEPPLWVAPKTGCMPTMTLAMGLAPTQENSTPCPNGPAHVGTTFGT